MTLFNSFDCSPILPASSSSFRLEGESELWNKSVVHSFNYLHRVPRQLVHNDRELGFIESPGYMLHKNSENFLFFLGGHGVAEAAMKSTSWIPLARLPLPVCPPDVWFRM